MLSHAKKRNLSTFILAALVLLLLLAHLFISYKQNSSTTPAPLLNENIIRIALSVADKPRIELSRENESADWFLNAPITLRAQAQRVTPLVNALQQFSASFAADELNLNSLGLQPPAASVSINEQTMLLGDKALDGERRYAMLDKHVGFVPDWVFSLITGGVSALAVLDPLAQLPSPTHLQRANGERLAIAQNPAWQSLAAQQIILSADHSPEPDAQRFQILSLGAANNQASQPETMATLYIQQAYSLIQTHDAFFYVIDNKSLVTLLPDALQ